MNEIKHTPGPWEWVGHDLESNFPGHFESVIEVTVDCMTHCYGGCVNLKISDADARLIASAPDMALVLELLAAEADAGKVLIPSGLRLSIDAALIKAGRKEAPADERASNAGTLTAILKEYREGKRGLPTYAELAEIASRTDTCE